MRRSAHGRDRSANSSPYESPRALSSSPDLSHSPERPLNSVFDHREHHLENRSRRDRSRSADHRYRRHSRSRDAARTGSDSSHDAGHRDASFEREHASRNKGKAREIPRRFSRESDYRVSREFGQAPLIDQDHEQARSYSSPDRTVLQAVDGPTTGTSTADGPPPPLELKILGQARRVAESGSQEPIVLPTIEPTGRTSSSATVAPHARTLRDSIFAHLRTDASHRRLPGPSGRASASDPAPYGEGASPRSSLSPPPEAIATTQQPADGTGPSDDPESAGMRTTAITHKSTGTSTTTTATTMVDLSAPEIMAHTRARLAKLRRAPVAGIGPPSASVPGTSILESRPSTPTTASSVADTPRTLDSGVSTPALVVDEQNAGVAKEKGDADSASTTATEARLRTQAQLRVRLARAKREAAGGSNAQVDESSSHEAALREHLRTREKSVA
jgi:E3 ubiquitin-protein ligase Topors